MDRRTVNPTGYATTNLHWIDLVAELQDTRSRSDDLERRRARWNDIELVLTAVVPEQRTRGKRCDRRSP